MLQLLLAALVWGLATGAAYFGCTKLWSALVLLARTAWALAIPTHRAIARDTYPLLRPHLSPPMALVFALREGRRSLEADQERQSTRVRVEATVVKLPKPTDPAWQRHLSESIALGQRRGLDFSGFQGR